MTTADMLMRIDALARKIADSAARSDIESYCLAVNLKPAANATDEIRNCWYDIRQTEPEDAEFAESVLVACGYLELRGKLLRHPEHNHLVRPTE